ncbi:MAG: ATP-binding protein, partial [Longimicrobiales bacterium]|nr:ATP-binding protein [Longimicrobiales bacterium]
MSRRNVRLIEVVVRRMPGFPHGGPALHEVGPGVNLIAGPNASGKTTLVRAIRSLLWSGNPHGASIHARVAVDEEIFTVDLDGTREVWRGESDGEPPILPPAEGVPWHHLSLHTLLVEEGESFARRIGVETAGGHDLRAAAESVGFQRSRRPRA